MADSAENTNDAADTTLLSDKTADAKPDTKPDDATVADTTKTDDKGDDKAAEVPVFDPSKAQLPEGFEKLDDGLMAEFGPIAEELKLSQEQGQKLIAMHANTLKSMQDAQQKAQGEQLEQWAKDAKADKELGGDKFDQNLTVAKSALDKFGSPALREMLDASGLGNHPEVIRVFHKIGKAIAEDSPVTAKPDTGQKKSIEERLYGG